MLNLMSNVKNFTEIYSPFFTDMGNIILRHPLADLIKKVAYPVFKATTSSYLASFGSFELSRLNAARSSQMAADKAYLSTHGALITASGACGIVEMLDRCGIVTLGQEVSKALFMAGSLFFLMANIIALEENVRLYEIAESLPPQDETTFWLRRSAVSGMLSNINYIIATATLLLGGPTAIALVIGAIGAMSGAFKILCDFVMWAKERSPDGSLHGAS